MFSENDQAIAATGTASKFGPATMSSREIAELAAKRHPDVKRDIEKMLHVLDEDARKFAHIYFDSMNREQTEYRLDRDLTENLLLGYSAPLRRKVLARLRELEGIVSDPSRLLSDPVAMRGFLLNYTEKVLALEAKVDELEPAKAALDRFSEADGSLCITDAAKALQMRPKDLFDWLRQNGWIYIQEAAKLIVQAGALSEGGDVFLLDMGEPISIMEMAENMVRLAGFSVRSDQQPDGDIEIVVTGKRPGEKLYEELFYDSDSAAPTQHPKIMRAPRRAISDNVLTAAVTTLDDAVSLGDEQLARRVLFDVIRERERQPAVVA